jgi:hypothetical protein
VAMKAGNPAHTSNPLIAPSKAPKSSTSARTATIGMPAASSEALTTETSATIDPTERSMPPVAMTKVMPTPMMMMGAAWRATLRRLLGFRKCSDSEAIATIHIISAISIPCRTQRTTPRRSAPFVAPAFAGIRCSWVVMTQIFPLR